MDANELESRGPAANRVPIENAGVEVRDGVPVVVINGEQTYFACHYLRNYYPALRDRWPEGITDSVARFVAQGIHRFEAPASSGWTDVDTFDPAQRGRCGYPVDRLLDTIVAADPHAQVVLRIGCRMVPQAVMDKSPDELARDQDGRTSSVTAYPGDYEFSFASDLGFAAMAGMFARLIAHVENGPNAVHVAGYNIFLQHEGVPWCCLGEGAFTDYSPAMLAAWRLFLERTYGGSVDALRFAWGDPAADFAAAALPTPDEHLGGDARQVFLHPVRDRKVRDYYALVDELVIGRHRQVARAAKDACGRRKLVGLMGGYNQDAGEPRSIMSETGFPELQLHKQHFGGVGCWGECFEIPDIDFYFAPTDYLNTGMGGTCLTLNMPASLKLHGKLAWMEDDQRTHLYGAQVFNPNLGDVSESVAVHQRNMGLLYTEAGLSDWMEQVSNWLLDPDILSNLRGMEQRLQESAGLPDDVDAICVLFDEESQGWTRPTTLLDEVLFYHWRNKGLSYCGVPVRHHLLSDLEHDDFPAYKCFVLPNAWHWTSAKEALLGRVKRDGNVLLWLYGAGYVGDAELDAGAMRAATGIHVECDAVPWEHRISITDYGHPITSNLPGDLSFGTSRHYGPIFRVVDPDARELGRTFGNRMNRHVGLAVREFGNGARGSGPGARGVDDYASIYCEAPDLPAALVRELARYAGTHVYLETNDVLFAGKDLVVVHSAKPGPRTLALPRGTRVTEAFTGLDHSVEDGRVDFDIPAGGGTFVFAVR